MAQLGPYHIMLMDIHPLVKPRAWLLDQIVNAHLHMVVERAKSEKVKTIDERASSDWVSALPSVETALNTATVLKDIDGKIPFHVEFGVSSCWETRDPHQPEGVKDKDRRQEEALDAPCRQSEDETGTVDKHKHGNLSAGLHAALRRTKSSRTTSLGEGGDEDYVFVFPEELQIREEVTSSGCSVGLPTHSALLHLRYMQLPYDKCKEKECRAQVNIEPEAKPVRGQYRVPAVKQYWKDENTTTIREKRVDGLGKCTHASGLLFAVEDFTRRGLKSHATPLSCTSMLSVWNVPRNDKVEPQPISKITIRKIRFGKNTRRPICARYDPSESVLSIIKAENPTLCKVFLRSDNAGCYHCAPLLLSMPAISQKTGISVLRYDFSDPQAGKHICDRKIASMKTHIRRFVNERHDVVTAEDMKQALESHGGVKGCRVAVCQLTTGQEHPRLRLEGIKVWNNFRFEGDLLRVWKPLESGKDLTTVTITLPFGPSHAQPSNMSISRCYKPGCVGTFRSTKELEEHVDVGKHHKELERESSYDKIRKQWARAVTGLTQGQLGAQRQQQIEAAGSETSTLPQTHHITEGWALRQFKRGQRMSDKTKSFLTDIFNEGATSGQKADAAQVAQQMVTPGCPRLAKFYLYKSAHTPV
ncbi:hypothetical protein Bbelb_317190 [Branchiostoma belcheri]|nr:hypothetical protein Bbelb_317190 [Branchiostoma belcheri]